MTKRTTIQFDTNGDIWPVVERWASDNGYRPKQSNGHERLYQKGTGFLVAPMMLKVRHAGQETNVEAWISTNIVSRAMSLFILPAEMGIASGGFKAVVPRSMARKAVNTLLAQLGQPAIP